MLNSSSVPTTSNDVFFYETVNSMEVNVSYAGKRIRELHDMAQGLAALCHAAIRDDLFCIESCGTVMVIASAAEKMQNIAMEIYPMQNGVEVIREVAS